MPEQEMGAFWDKRAKENAYFFVDNRRGYRDQDLEAFWAEGEKDLSGIIDLLGLEIAPSDTVLDIGCGPGRLTRALATRAAAVQGIDVSAEMVELARKHNATIENVTFIHGDGTSLNGVEDASVNGVFSHVVFQHIPDPQITLGYIREIGRVLKPNGWAGFQISNDPTIHKPPKATSLVRVCSRLLAMIGRRPHGQANPAWLGSAVDLDDLRRVASESGLTLEQIVGEGTQFCMIRARRG
jgi:SAM-dependent methyltransferase